MTYRIGNMPMRVYASMAITISLLFSSTPALSVGICAVTISGTMQESIVITDPSGVSTAPMPTLEGRLSIDPLTDVEAMLLAEGTYRFFFAGDGQYRIVWQQGPDPSSASVTCDLDGTRTHAYSYGIVKTSPGFGAELTLTVGAAPVLSIDSDGNGTLDTVVTPDIAVSGAAASDATPPTITHTRLADGQHVLALVDNELDISESGQLLYSLGDGSGYIAYTEPIELNSRNSPRILAIGRDLAGNRSDEYGFLTRNENLPFCDRLEMERQTIQTVTGSVLSQAVTDNLILTNHGITMASIGPGACLWQRDAEGKYLACDTCKGRYAPIFDAQRILVLFPDAISNSTRDQILELLHQSATSTQNDLTELSFTADDRPAFESGQRSTAAGLASQIQLLEWLLQAEYLDLASQGPDVSGASISAALASLQDAGISPVEGYEYSLQSENLLLNMGLLVRVIAMNEELIPMLPQLDSYLGRLLRDQLNTTANQALRTAFATLVASECATQAELTTVSREEFATTACDDGPCSSFAEYSLARATVAESQCPGIFSPTQLQVLDGFARLVAHDATALAETIGNECTANTLLANALNLIRLQQEVLRPDYILLMQELATVNPEEHALRQANANQAQIHIASLESRPAINLRLSLVNTGTAGQTEASIAMYDNGSPNGQQVDITSAGETVQLFTGDYTSNAPFYIEIDSAAIESNIVQDVGFTLQTPNVQNTVSDQQTFGSLQYYLFNPEDPICPNPTPVERPVDGGGG